MWPRHVKEWHRWAELMSSPASYNIYNSLGVGVRVPEKVSDKSTVMR